MPFRHVGRAEIAALANPLVTRSSSLLGNSFAIGYIPAESAIAFATPIDPDAIV